ncbi:MAG TPA: M48 family metalloprotease [Terracidiphilus sp.]
MNVIRTLLCLCVLSALAPLVPGQQSACTVPEPQFKINKPNIFSEQQEQWLGEAQADQLESEYYLLTEKDSAELTRIGQKLLAQLPPTAIHFTFRVYLSEEANAFSSAGGFVYISSKTITDAHSEDELAAVLSHEIGHIYSHAVAIAFTRELKALMKVTAVTDKADIAEKVQLLINAPWKTGAGEDYEDAEKDEVQADSIGLYAMARAGYSPPAFAQNLDRISDNRGRSVTFFRALGGENTTLIVRVRTARKLADALSGACKSTPSISSASFVEFQKKLRNDAFHWQVDATAGLKSTLLTPPIRPSLDEVRFSPDGNYVLAQEESAVHVLRRNPLKLLFTIDAENANAAKFSPDSSRITIPYPSMRVETWNLSTHERESVHELVDYKGCPVHSLSPDGKTYVCIRASESGIGLTFIDVESEKVYYENKKWDEYGVPWESVKIRYTPDGHTMLIVAGRRSMAYDLDHRTPISLHGEIGDMFAGPIAFAGSNKLVFSCGMAEPQKGGGYLLPICVSSFPSGQKLNKFFLGDEWMEGVTRGDSVLIGPLGNNPAVLYDVNTGKPTAAFKMASVDMYDTSYASETPLGQVAVKDLAAGQPQVVDLPIRPLSPIAAGGFSPDGRYLAYSNGSRGVLWDLESNAAPVVVRPFTSMQFTSGSQMLVRLKMAHQKPGAIVSFDLAAKKSAEGAKFEKYQSVSSGVLVAIEPLEKGYFGTNWDTVLHVSDPMTGKELWSRKFPHNTPEVYGTDRDALMIVTNLRSETGEGEEGHNGAKLVKTSDTMKEWNQTGLLVEIVNAHTGEVERVVHTPTRPAWGDDERWPALYGDYLAVHGNVNNTVVYRVSDGVRTAAFYGRVLAGDGKMGLLAVNNRDQEMIVYNAANGAEVLRVTLDHLPRAARFIPATNSLLVLTATQRVYSISLADAKTMTATK